MPRSNRAVSITAQSEMFGGLGEETRLFCTNIAARGSQGNLCLAVFLVALSMSSRDTVTLRAELR